jgi:serine/threonine-protein kinase HipA
MLSARSLEVSRLGVDAEVRLHGHRVGALRYEQRGTTFVYEDNLASSAHRTLGQIFEDNPRERRIARTGLPPWFANLLPEGELRKQVVREMGGGNIGDFTLLLRLGSDLPGAVTVRSEQEPEDDVEITDAAVESADHPLRHSLAGMQLKFSVHGDRLTFPATGEGAWWIAKLPDRALKDLSINEYLTMRWLRAAGMKVPDVQLVPASAVSGIPAGLIDPTELIYLVKRFDRASDRRIHVEDFAQVADVPPILKYSQSGATYDSLAIAMFSLLGADGFAEYTERLVAMLVVGNTDAHLKNWALIYLNGVTPSLSPVYDFHSLTVYTQYRYAPFALSLDGEVGSSTIYWDSFRKLADAAGADPERTVQVVHNTVERLRAAWSGELKAEADRRFPALSHHFSERLTSLPICG